MKKNNQPDPKIMPSAATLFRNEEGAIDLASIMVGIIVIGLVGGVIAATVFAIIPWSQDNAAKQQLDSIVAAQSAYKGLSSGVPPAVPEGHPSNSYADSSLLASAGLMAEGESFCIVTTDNGNGYQAVSVSASGAYWLVTDKSSKPQSITLADAPDDCGNLPYMDRYPTQTKMTYLCEADQNVTIPLVGAKGTATWSDGGTTTHGGTDTISKTLEAGKTYQFVFDGTYSAFGNLAETVSTSSPCLLSLDHWGAETGVIDATNAFLGASNLTDIPRQLPPTIKTAQGMFSGATLLNDPDISQWDVSNVTNMQQMFNHASSFNQPLNDWDVSNVTTTRDMFRHAATFNQNINDWDTGNVKNMLQMFNYAKSFNQPLNDWDVSKVGDIGGMFWAAVEFNQPLDKWDTSSVGNLSSTFSGARKFNQDISSWDVSNVTRMPWVFTDAYEFNSPLNDWDVSSATDMQQMFMSAKKFDQPLDKWNVSKITNMQGVFQNAPLFKQNLSNWKTVSVTNGTLFAPTDFPDANMPARTSK